MQHTYLESVTIPISVKNSCTNQIVGKNPRIVAQIRTLRKKNHLLRLYFRVFQPSVLFTTPNDWIYICQLSKTLSSWITTASTSDFRRPIIICNRPEKNEVKVNLLFCLVERHYSIHLRLILLLRLAHRTPNLGQPGRQVWGRTATCTTDLLFIMVTLLTNIACLTIPCFSLMIGSVSIFFRNIIFLEVLLYSDPYQRNFDVN